MQTLGLGFTWEELSPGQRFRTLNRTDLPIQIF